MYRTCQRVFIKLLSRTKLTPTMVNCGGFAERGMRTTECHAAQRIERRSSCNLTGKSLLVLDGVCRQRQVSILLEQV